MTIQYFHSGRILRELELSLFSSSTFSLAHHVTANNAASSIYNESESSLTSLECMFCSVLTVTPSEHTHSLITAKLIQQFGLSSTQPSRFPVLLKLSWL